MMKSTWSANGKGVQCHVPGAMLTPALPSITKARMLVRSGSALGSSRSFGSATANTLGAPPSGMKVWVPFRWRSNQENCKGRWQDRRTAVDPVLTAGPILDGRERLAITSLAVPGSGPVLGEALLPHGSLGDVDPAAAEASEPTDRPVWYLRLLAPGRPGEPGGVAWLVLEDGSGRILARGGAG